MSFWDKKERKKLIEKLPFYNFLIEKLKIITDLLQKLPFYDKLSVVKISKAFRGYARRKLK